MVSCPHTKVRDLGGVAGSLAVSMAAHAAVAAHVDCKDPRPTTLLASGT